MRNGVLFAFSLLLCICLVACGNTPAETTGPIETIAITEAAEELGIPETGDFGGHTFTILYAGHAVSTEFGFEEESAIALENAQYKRVKTVEQAYNVDIVEVQKKSSATNGNGAGYQELSKAANAGTTDYDLTLTSAYDVSVLAYNGYLYDMASIPGIDLSKSWWDQNATDSLTVNGVTFFTTGDITVSDNYATFALMFNKKLLKDYGLESPYDMVYDGTWTFEKFGKMCKTVSEDLDQDGVMDTNDRFGLLVWDDSIVGVVNAAGERCATIGADGEIQLTFYNDTTLAALEQYAAIAYDTEYALTYQRHATTAEVLKTMWPGDQALFLTSYMSSIQGCRSMESDFGILPYPKLNEQQDAYYSCVAPYNARFICVPLVQEDVERTGVITEALAYYGKQIVTPAYYDVNLIGLSTRDEESSDMLDIIFGNRVYDIGYFYQIGPYNKQLILMLREYQTNFASMYDTYRPAAEATLKVINQFYGEAVAEWEK